MRSEFRAVRRVAELVGAGAAAERQRRRAKRDENNQHHAGAAQGLGGDDGEMDMAEILSLVRDARDVGKFLSRCGPL
jgi:hypothetical protein